MTIKDLRKKTPAELLSNIEKLRTEIASYRRDSKTDKEKNIRLVSNHKREIARTKTVIREQEQDKSTIKEDK